MSTCFGSWTSQSVMRSWNCEPPFEPFCTSTLGLTLPEVSIATRRETA